MPKNKKTAHKPDPKAAENMVADRILELLDRGELPPGTALGGPAASDSPATRSPCAPTAASTSGSPASPQELKGYDDPRWLTLKQANGAGGTVRKGETSTRIVFWKTITRQGEDDPEKTVSFPVARMYSVFNVEQTQDCDLPPLPEPPAVPDPIAQAEAIIAAMPNPPRIETYQHRNHAPCYIPPLDVVRVPHVTRYESQELYYNTVYHELTHAMGHPTRLGRFEAHVRSNLHDYGVEELVAGMGSAMLAGAGRHRQRHHHGRRQLRQALGRHHPRQPVHRPQRRPTLPEGGGLHHGRRRSLLRFPAPSRPVAAP